MKGLERSYLVTWPTRFIFSLKFFTAKWGHFLLLLGGYQKYYTVKSITFIISTLGNFEITQIKGMKTSTMGGLGTGAKHCLFSQLTNNSIISKHIIFSFFPFTCLVPVKVNHHQYKLFPFLVESFPSIFWPCRVTWPNLHIHRYQNDKICKLLQSYDIRTKA